MLRISSNEYTNSSVIIWDHSFRNKKNKTGLIINKPNHKLFLTNLTISNFTTIKVIDQLEFRFKEKYLYSISNYKEQMEKKKTEFQITQLWALVFNIMQHVPAKVSQNQ